eukprot:scaffold21631_cov19-Prasinocladus_malaysianus.AAC.1
MGSGSSSWAILRFSAASASISATIALTRSRVSCTASPGMDASALVPTPDPPVATEPFPEL